MSDGQIYELLPQVAAAIQPVGKDRKASMGSGGTFAFRGVDDLLNACHAALSDHHISLVPSVADHRMIERERVKEGKVVGMTIHVVVTVDYLFAAPDGSSVTVRTVGEAADTGDKATSKAMSQALKYALMHTFTVPTLDMAAGDKAKVSDMGTRTTSARPAPDGYDRQRRNKRLMALYNDAGITDRDARLSHSAFVVGRDIGSAKDLTDDELEQVIHMLEDSEMPA